jgi:hypothetical protein
VPGTSGTETSVPLLAYCGALQAGAEARRSEVIPSPTRVLLDFGMECLERRSYDRDVENKPCVFKWLKLVSAICRPFRFVV